MVVSALTTSQPWGPSSALRLAADDGSTAGLLVMALIFSDWLLCRTPTQ
jgi:hypothetical protein